MIKHLAITNYAIIDHLEIDFFKGLTTVTGETGSGKSIIIGGIRLLLGERADSVFFKDKSKKCIIEGTFDLSNANLTAFFEDNNLDFEQETLLRRELSPNGKSRAFINDTPVKLSLLHEFGIQLVDIHSQHQTLLLNNKKFQIELIDAMALNKEMTATYSSTFLNYKNAQLKLEVLIELRKKTLVDADYNNFRLEELSSVELDPTSIAEDEKKVKELEHAEEIKNAFTKTLSVLENEANSTTSNLKLSINTLKSIEQFIPIAGAIHTRIKSLLIELEDILAEIDSTQEDISINPGLLDALHTKLDHLYALQHKHNVNTVEDLIEIKDKLTLLVNETEGFDEQITTLKKEVEITYQEALKEAEKISFARKKIAPELINRVSKLLSQMNMEDAAIDIKFEQIPLSIAGIDLITFVFKANKGGNFAELKSIASGGELSRLMLALKSTMVGKQNTQTIIFDEIDSGVSGEVAGKMGTIMKGMSSFRQVIAITHLPQIACKGDVHYKVIKTSGKKSVAADMLLLNKDERINEIALMLSSERVTDAAIENAKALLYAE